MSELRCQQEIDTSRFQSLSRIDKPGPAEREKQFEGRGVSPFVFACDEFIIYFCRRPFHEGVSKQHLWKQSSTGLNLQGRFSRRHCLFKKKKKRVNIVKSNSGGFGCIQSVSWVWLVASVDRLLWAAESCMLSSVWTRMKKWIFRRCTYIGMSEYKSRRACCASRQTPENLQSNLVHLLALWSIKPNQ